MSPASAVRRVMVPLRHRSATARAAHIEKGRSRISPKPPLICDSLESGRQDLNLRPLDPQE